MRHHRRSLPEIAKILMVLPQIYTWHLRLRSISTTRVHCEGCRACTARRRYYDVAICVIIPSVAGRRLFFHDGDSTVIVIVSACFALL